jgi:hypothetical protein
LECGEHRRFAFGFFLFALSLRTANPLQRCEAGDKRKAKGKAAMLAALHNEIASRHLPSFFPLTVLLENLYWSVIEI